MSRLLSKSWTRSVEPVLRRLNAYGPLDQAETALVQGLDGRLEQFKPGAELVRAGGSAARPRFLLSGWACRQRVLPDGRRQIFEFLLPGDGLGFCGPHGPAALASTVAITAVETIGADGVQEAIRNQPSSELAKAMAAGASEQEARLLDSLVRLGRQTAYERVAHLLLELHRRLSVVGLAYDQRFSMPLTQEVLSDALGLSVVHVNRILQQLRREHLIELRSGGAILRAPAQLAIIADFRG
jgi:CRP-like cAMP-binding protein